LVKPGKTGEITLVIALKGRRDPFDVSATVSFTGDVAPQVIKCTVIPYGYIKVEPRVLTWSKNEPLKSKVFTVDLSHAKDSQLVNASSLSSSSFGIESEYDGSNNLWRLSVLPKDGAPTVQLVTLSFVNAKHEKRQFYLAVKRE
jgi:hypothetical protein